MVTALDAYANEENLFSAKLPRISMPAILLQVLINTLLAVSVPPNWFLGVKNGARGGRWPLRRYLNQKKLGSFVNSSQTVPGIHNAAGANAVIEWEYNANPRLMRAVLRARVAIARGQEILWDYPWV